MAAHPLLTSRLWLIFLALFVWNALGERLHVDEILSRILKPEKDPLGDNDSLGMLSEKEKKILSVASEVGTASKLKFIESLETTVTVHVRLVGFQGDGNLSLKLKEVRGILDF